MQVGHKVYMYMSKKTLYCMSVHWALKLIGMLYKHVKKIKFGMRLFHLNRA